MPWKATDTMRERHLLLADYLGGTYTMTELSVIYGVSRKTVYKWVNRYEEFGFEGLEDRSRRPLGIPHQTDSALLDMLVAVKRRHASWGPRKVVRHLSTQRPDLSWPAPSTVGEWFKRLGLVTPRRRRLRVPSYTEPFRDCAGPNAVWSADFKGPFKTGDGLTCYPLTISDNFSRYLLVCQGLLNPDYAGCRAWFEWAFRRYGLPGAIRTDNGTPFAGLAKGGLSRLSIWWIKLGIVPERIDKGCPQQNGRHERMHRTLKAETASPPEASLFLQQQSFGRFQAEYNEERPHEALEDRPPGSVYERSSRPYPKKVLELKYDADMVVRRIRQSGEFQFEGRYYFVSSLLTGERIGLRPMADGNYSLWFGFHPLGTLNRQTRRIDPET